MWLTLYPFLVTAFLVPCGVFFSILSPSKNSSLSVIPRRGTPEIRYTKSGIQVDDTRTNPQIFFFFFERHLSGISSPQSSSLSSPSVSSGSPGFEPGTKLKICCNYSGQGHEPGCPYSSQAIRSQIHCCTLSGHVHIRCAASAKAETVSILNKHQPFYQTSFAPAVSLPSQTSPVSSALRSVFS